MADVLNGNERLGWVESPLRVAIEAVIVGLVVLTPWPLASVGFGSMLALSLALLLLSILWAVRFCVIRRWNRHANLPLACLSGVVVVSVFQLAPLPESVVGLLSPGSRDIHQYYLPPEPEVLPGEPTAARKTSYPISICPSDTRYFLAGCLSVSILFVVVANAVVSASAFRRLAIAIVVTAGLVSLLGFAQRLSSPDRVIYWTIPVGNFPFGPFVNRDNFPYLGNLALGLAVGMLAASIQKRPHVLHNATALWLTAAVSILVVANMVALSRAGFLAMVLGLSAGVVVRLRTGQGALGAGRVLWLVPVIVVVAVWYGGTVWERIAKTDSKALAAEGRFDAWLAGMKAVPRFPLFGTGNGTFGWVEQHFRKSGKVDGGYFDHAHNEYVDALVEGGVVRLAFTVGFVFFVSRAAVRNFRRYRDRSLGWLILGGLVGFWAIAVHSIFDFGIHVPAIAVAATVVAAHLVCIRQNDTPDSWVELPRPACLLLAPAIVAVAGLLAWHSYLAWQGSRYAVTAVQLHQAGGPAARQKAIEYMSAAAAYQPDNYDYHWFLAQRFSEEATDNGRSPERTRAILSHARRVRDLSPLGSNANVLLGLNRDGFDRAPTAAWYVERACRARPIDPTPWYTLGWERLRAGDPAGAARDWRRSLECSDRHLKPIFESARTVMSPAELLEQVLPDRPAIIKAAAELLENDGPDQVAYRQRALRLLESRPDGERTGTDEWLRGTLLIELGRDDEGLVALRKGIERDGNLTGLRWDLAKELYRREDFKEARRQAKTLLSFEPHNTHARDLLEMIERDLLISGD